MEKQISLFKNPIITMTILFKLIIEFLIEKFNKYKYRLLVALIIIIIYTLIALDFIKLNNFYRILFEKYNSIIIFCLYWIILGVASSIGLGSGLHTFVLYLGPKAAKFVMAADECKSIPIYTNGRYSLNSDLDCGIEILSFWNLLRSLELEALLWGLGTAIGELPPYLLAKKASIESKKSNLDTDNSVENNNFLNKIKNKFYSYIKNYAFISIVLFASIPNPLFDLVGITCGHFLIPFYTFFIGIIIGKAINKANLQMMFIIFLFSEKNLRIITNFFIRLFPNYQENIMEFVIEQKQNIISKHIKDSKPFIAVLWDYLITVIIIYFFVSIINLVVNNHLNKKNKKIKSN